jgi:hypothetical protein
MKRANNNIHQHHHHYYCIIQFPFHYKSVQFTSSSPSTTIASGLDLLCIIIIVFINIIIIYSSPSLLHHSVPLPLQECPVHIVFPFHYNSFRYRFIVHNNHSIHQHHHHIFIIIIVNYFQ